MWDKIEVWARLVRNSFLLVTIVVFVAANLGAFQDNQALMWLFFVFGILALLSTGYIHSRDINLRLKAAAITDARLSSHLLG